MNSNTGQATGVAIGSTYIEASYYFPGNGQGGQACSLFNPNCGSVEVNWSCPTNVIVAIFMGSTNITNTPQSAVVGQQIVLTASASSTTVTWPPSGKTVQNISWSPQGTYVTSYQPSTGNTQVAKADLNSQSATFYWAYPGQSLTETLTVNFTDGTYSTAAVTFNVTGPTGGSMTATIGGHVSIANLGACTDYAAGPWIFYGASITGTCSSMSGNAGIQFNSPSNYSNASGGNFKLVQVINSDSLSGSYSYTWSTGLDGAYPYVGTNDAPGSPLFASYSTLTRAFNATMYLLWQPTSSGSIPVPIASLTWSFNGTANCSTSCTSASNWSATTNSASTTTTFTASSGSQANYGFPTWSGLSQ